MGTDELRALISLIDDPDETIYSQVRESIVELGHEAVSELDRAYYEKPDPIFQERVTDILDVITFNDIKRRLEEWASAGGQDLLEGTILASYYHYPSLDTEKIKGQLEVIRKDIESGLSNQLTAYEKVQVFNHTFFQVHGFRGNKKNYHALPNNFISDVLDTRKGNPLSLSIIYQLVAESLGLSIQGVNLPSHFVLAYVNKNWIGDRANGQHVLFYINAFSQGDILGRNEIDEFLVKLKVEPKPAFYRPATNLDIIRRQLNNVASSYSKVGDKERTKKFVELRDVLPPSSGEK